MVVATAAIVRLDLRRPAEFRADHNKGFFQQTARGQIGQQRSVSLIEILTTRLHRGEIVDMGVPAAERDLDKPHAVLDQSTREQTSLGKSRAAIEFLGRRGLFLQIEGPQILALHQPHSLLIEAPVSADVGMRKTLVEGPVQSVGK